jgi:protein-L-isoaspartate(D-aspartate) O-methyltransferase
MHAHALCNLEPYLREGSKVLDVGCGSGYRESVARQSYFTYADTRIFIAVVGVLSHLVGPTGKVVGIEHIQGLVDLSRNNLVKDGFNIGPDGQGPGISLVLGDGRKGMPLPLEKWSQQQPRVANVGRCSSPAHRLEG